MPKRYVSIWFRYLLTDRHAIRYPEFKGKTFVFVESQRGRKVITAVSAPAYQQGLSVGMTVADAKATVPDMIVLDGKPGLNEKLLKALAEWCLRYTPLVAIDPPDGLMLDATGCTHLKGGERAWLKDLADRLKELGYYVRPAMADTIGCAWGVARWAKSGLIVAEGGHRNALMPLPAAALRLTNDLLVKLDNLGLRTINTFIHMPKSVLQRRFGKQIVLRLWQAIGQEEEFLLPINEPVPHSERLACLEPVKTRPAIEHALRELLEIMCKRLYGEGKGLRAAILTYYRIDGKLGRIEIGTNHPTQRVDHVFKLFSLKLEAVAPGLGIELFVLDVPKIEDVTDKQVNLWAEKPGAESEEVAELLDNIAGRIGPNYIRLYMPREHYWPERAATPQNDIRKKPETEWRTDKPRPFQTLEPPEPIDAMALTPDYPPKFFVYRGRRHTIVAADGPERIEREWWEDEGGHRDYYIVEDENGGRYWLFWSGHFDPHQPQHWFIHGFFA
jgi:protein ImuB